jgi:hypothetical protein
MADDDGLERAWALPSDATPLQRLLAFRPKSGPGWRHHNALIAKLCREQGLPLPWADQWPSDGSPTK